MCKSELGNLITLFHCLVSAHVSSSQDENKVLLEIDNAIFTYFSDSILSIDTLKNELLNIFPILYATSIKSKNVVLIIGIHEKWIHHFINSY